MPDSIPTTRPITRKALRRSWREPAVRSLWMTALAVLGVFGWVLCDQLIIARSGHFRLDHWTRIDAAKLEKIGDTTRANYRVTPDMLASRPVKISYRDAAGASHELEGTLEAQKNALSPGQSIPILVDPKNPSHWTDRVTPVPLIEELMAPLLLLPLPFIFGLAAFWQQKRIIHLWRTGILREGIVVRRRNSATAPQSSIVLCTIQPNRESRLVSVSIPRSVVRFEPGDPIKLVTPSGDSTRAIASILYEES